LRERIEAFEPRDRTAALGRALSLLRRRHTQNCEERRALSLLQLDAQLDAYCEIAALGSLVPLFRHLVLPPWLVALCFFSRQPFLVKRLLDLLSRWQTAFREAGPENEDLGTYLRWVEGAFGEQELSAGEFSVQGDVIDALEVAALTRSCELNTVFSRSAMGGFLGLQLPDL
jgi:hypothetical protein